MSVPEIKFVDWKAEATRMFRQYVREAKHYKGDDGLGVVVSDLSLINASKATVLSELLEKFGAKPKVEA